MGVTVTGVRVCYGSDSEGSKGVGVRVCVGECMCGSRA